MITKAEELKVGMKFRVNHLCFDFHFEIIAIKDGIIYTRNLFEARHLAATRDETGRIIHNYTIEEFLDEMKPIHYYNIVEL